MREWKVTCWRAANEVLELYMSKKEKLVSKDTKLLLGIYADLKAIAEMPELAEDWMGSLGKGLEDYMEDTRLFVSSYLSREEEKGENLQNDTSELPSAAEERQAFERKTQMGRRSKVEEFGIALKCDTGELDWEYKVMKEMLLVSLRKLFLKNPKDVMAKLNTQMVTDELKKNLREKGLGNADSYEADCPMYKVERMEEIANRKIAKVQYTGSYVGRMIVTPYIWFVMKTMQIFSIW